jgi:hypothetical protein
VLSCVTYRKVAAPSSVRLHQYNELAQFSRHFNRVFSFCCKRLVGLVPARHWRPPCPMSDCRTCPVPICVLCECGHTLAENSATMCRILRKASPPLAEEEAPFPNTHTVFEPIKIFGHGSRLGPKPKAIVLARTSSSLLSCYGVNGVVMLHSRFPLPVCPAGLRGGNVLDFCIREVLGSNPAETGPT